MNMLIFIIISIIIIIVGVVMLGFNIYKSYFSNYVETEGAIIDFERRENYDSENGRSVTYAPVIQYEVDGVTYTYTSKVSSSHRPQIGTNISIMYDPNDPNKRVRKNDLTGLIFVVVGIIFLFASFYMVK